MERCKMLTEEQLKKIQEAMKDTEFAKSVMETKTEEGLVSLLKDKKGITVSVEDIKVTQRNHTPIFLMTKKG